jgi:hypothetical protein
MSLERIKETIKNKVENFQARREFYSMMPIGDEKLFEVRVKGTKELLVIPGYYPSDIVFNEIKKRVEPGSNIEIRIDPYRLSGKIIHYHR